MPDLPEDKLQVEIEHIVATIASVENGRFEGPMKYQVLELLRSSLALHRRSLGELEAARRGES